MKKLLKNLKRVIKREVPLSDVYHYLLGNYRYKIYYSYLPHISWINLTWLLRRHISEQIEYRISVMKRECYDRGQCIKCQCDTTHLQMANKRCKGYCYPTMMGKADWGRFKQGSTVWDKVGDGVWLKMWVVFPEGDKIYKHIFHKETPTGYVRIKDN